MSLNLVDEIAVWPWHEYWTKTNPWGPLASHLVPELWAVVLEYLPDEEQIRLWHGSTHFSLIPSPTVFIVIFRDLPGFVWSTIYCANAKDVWAAARDFVLVGGESRLYNIFLEGAAMLALGNGYAVDLMAMVSLEISNAIRVWGSSLNCEVLQSERTSQLILDVAWYATIWIDDDVDHNTWNDADFGMLVQEIFECHLDSDTPLSVESWSENGCECVLRVPERVPVSVQSLKVTFHWDQSPSLPRLMLPKHVSGRPEWAARQNVSIRWSQLDWEVWAEASERDEPWPSWVDWRKNELDSPDRYDVPEMPKTTLVVAPGVDPLSERAPQDFHD